MELSSEILTNIETLILGCDESILSIDFLNDYRIEMVSIDDFQHKQQIVDGSGRVLFHYNKILNPIMGNSYIRLYKERRDVIKIDMEPHKRYPIPNKEISIKIGV